MKILRNLTILFAASTICVISSCSKEDSPVNKEDSISIISASIGQLTDENVTKTQLGDFDGSKYPILWSAGDAIAVSSKTGNQKVQYTLVGDGGTKTATFSTSDTKPSGEVYSFYPYSAVSSVASNVYTVTIPQQQAYNAKGFADGIMPMYGSATSADGVIDFNPLFSVLKIQLTGSVNVKKIVIKSDTENLCGTATVDMTNGAVNFTDGKKSVELVCSPAITLSSTATLFQIVIPSATSKNYSVYVVTDNNYVMVQNTNDKTFTAGVIKKMKTLAFSALTYPEGNGYALMLGNTVWAPVNCGYANTDVKTRLGRLYQWGRRAGCYWGSSTQTAVSGRNNSPSDNQFIYGNNTSPYDWRVDQLTSWTDENTTTAVGNPCPSGWRVPTIDELGDLCYSDYNPSTKTGSSLRGSIVGTSGSAGSGWNFTYDGSNLFFPHSGSRAGRQDGDKIAAFSQENVAGTYFSSTTNGIYVYSLIVATSNSNRVWFDSSSHRINGFSVRCVKK